MKAIKSADHILAELSSLTYDDLCFGLEWIYKNIKVTVKYNGNYIDVIAHPDYPSKSHSIVLSINVSSSYGPIFQDLVGNGYGTDYQDQGYGTLLVNVGIQAIWVFFSHDEYNDYRDAMQASGKTSNVDDPEEDPEKSNCRDRRNHFWQGFGFAILDPMAFRSRMVCRLSDLKLKDKRLANGDVSCLVSLKDFWRIGNRPKVFRHDIDEVMRIDVTRLGLDGCPSADDVHGKLRKAWQQLHFIKYLVLASLSVILLKWLSSILNWEGIILAMMACMSVLIFCLSNIEHRLVGFLPSYKQYSKLWETRSSIIDAAKEAVLEIEENNNNGLLWRLYPGVSEYLEDSETEIFKELSEWSKSQYALLISNKYEDYFHCVSVVQKIILANRIEGYVVLE